MTQLSSASLVVASNRGPLSYEESPDGSLTASRGAGGLVSALGPALRGRSDALWIAAALSDEDRRAAAEGIDTSHDVRVRLLDIPHDVYDSYYNVIANRYLWFVCHYLWDPSRTPSVGPEEREAWHAYEIVNRAFADAIAESAAHAAAAMVQDYHLALVPAMLRAARPDLRVGMFWHIPFPHVDYLRLLPDRWSRRIISGMLGADLVGFHARRWSDNFVRCASELLDAPTTSNWVSSQGHRTSVRRYPIGVDARGLTSGADPDRVAAERESLAAWIGDRSLVLRVDRVELSKNILRGLRAFEAVLERRADLHGTVSHLALLTPSRGAIPEYREYLAECERTGADIAKRFGTPDWEPVRVEIADQFARTLAAYERYDVLVVNPVFDGLNLVAREGPVLNRRDGVLVLSRNAGVWSELEPAAIGVNPFDVDGTAEAIEAALDMPKDERGWMAQSLKRLARGRSPAGWLERQLRDLPQG